MNMMKVFLVRLRLSASYKCTEYKVICSRLKLLDVRNFSLGGAIWWMLMR